MQSLMKGKDFFKAHQIYIQKADKGVAEIKFCYPMFTCEESCKECEESGKTCEESNKAPCENTSEPPFWKFFFALLKTVYQDIVEAFFKRKAPEANANFCVFESQCPKITVLSKALKAKLSSTLSGVTSLSTPCLDRTKWKKTTTVLPSFDHLLWRQLSHARGPVRGSFSMYGCVVRVEFWLLSLSRWRKVGLPLALWQESGPNFKGFTNGKWIRHWVFLRCDWSLVSS